MTKPTNEERREVAARLRGWVWRNHPPKCLMNSIAFGDECPGTDDDPYTIDCHQCEVFAAKRLADLVEPESERTCRKLPPLNSGDRYTLTAKYASGLEYSETLAYARCSECGTHFCDDFAYCPKCGAKVVDE